GSSTQPDIGAVVLAYLFLFVVIFVVTFVAQYLYVVVYQVRKGQTVGKRVMKIKIVRLADGAPINRSDATRRWLVTVGCSFLAPPRPHGYPVAPLGLRFLARLIDFGILLGLCLAANSWLLYLFFADFGPYAKAFLQAAQSGSRAAAPAVPNGIKYSFTLIPLV